MRAGDIKNLILNARWLPLVVLLVALLLLVWSVVLIMSDHGGAVMHAQTPLP